MAQLSNRMALAALIVSAASAAFAAGSYFTADAALKQEREMALIAQRAEACAVLSRLSLDVESAAEAAQVEFQQGAVRREGFYEQRESVLARLHAFNNASVLTFLGPEALAQSQDNLTAALTDVFIAVHSDEPNAHDMLAAIEAARVARTQFHSSCLQSIGHFRG